MSMADNSPISFDNKSSGKEEVENEPQEKPRLMGRTTLKRVGKAFSCSGIMAQRQGLKITICKTYTHFKFLQRLNYFRSTIYLEIFILRCSVFLAQNQSSGSSSIIQVVSPAEAD